MDQETVISSLFPTQILSTIGNHSLSFPLIRDQFQKQPLRQSSVCLGVPGKGLPAPRKKEIRRWFFIFSGHFPPWASCREWQQESPYHSSDEAGNQGRENIRDFRTGYIYVLLQSYIFLCLSQFGSESFVAAERNGRLPPSPATPKVGLWTWCSLRFLKNKYQLQINPDLTYRKAIIYWLIITVQASQRLCFQEAYSYKTFNPSLNSCQIPICIISLLSCPCGLLTNTDQPANTRGALNTGRAKGCKRFPNRISLVVRWLGIHLP